MRHPDALAVRPADLLVVVLFLGSLALMWYLGYELVRVAGRLLLPTLIGG